MKSPLSGSIGVVHTDGSSAGSSPAGEPERQWLPVESVPWGIPVQVRDAAGKQAIAIRHTYGDWFNESRSGTLEFIPTEWSTP